QLPSQLAEQLALQIAAVSANDGRSPRQVLNELMREDNPPDLSYADFFTVVPLQLEMQGPPALLIYSNADEQQGILCRSNNCPAWVYRVVGGHYERLLSTSSGYYGIRLQANRAHGLNDIEVYQHGSAASGGLTLWRFDGHRYRERQCWSVDYPNDADTPRKTPAPCGR
ncbi:MAG: hypothetical protein ACREJT_09030, partial [Myxococcota bacterium]